MNKNSDLEFQINYILRLFQLIKNAFRGLHAVILTISS